MTEYKVICADSHVNPPPDFWQDYLPASLRDLAPKVEHEDDADYIVFEGRRKKLNLIGAQAGRKGEDFKIEGKLSDMRGGGWMPDERLKDMDTDGLSAAVMFGGGPLGTTNDDLYIESFAAYNRWLADFCDYDRSRLIGVAYLPMRDVDESVRMLEDAAKRGFKAVNIPAFPQAKKLEGMKDMAGGAQAVALTGNPSGELQYDDPMFDKFWAAAVDNDIALTIHLGARMARFTQTRFFLPDLLMTKLSMAEPIALMIFGCVFQRHPKLRFCSIESGVGWFAFAANYMDETWRKQRYWTKSALKEP
ncbi:MAG: amidohydrolase family protein, partial [Novosphingobium sp.]